MANISQDKALEMIRRIVTDEGSQTEAAKRLDISVAYLRDILSGNRPVSDRVARKLGYRRAVVYVPLENDEKGKV